MKVLLILFLGFVIGMVTTWVGAVIFWVYETRNRKAELEGKMKKL